MAPRKVAEVIQLKQPVTKTVTSRPVAELEHYSLQTMLREKRKREMGELAFAQAELAKSNDRFEKFLFDRFGIKIANRPGKAERLQKK